MPPTVVNDYEHADLRAAAAGNTPMQSNLSPLQSLPSWLPDTVRLYLDHTEDGLSYRELARREGRHASTVMRAVRRYETRRDDPLFDDALAAVLRAAEQACAPIEKEETPMTAPFAPKPLLLMRQQSCRKVSGFFAVWLSRARCWPLRQTWKKPW